MRILVILFWLVPFLCSSQCDWIILDTQTDADDFIENYGLCKKIGSLKINFNCIDAGFLNVDSLINIEQVDYMEIRGGCSEVSLEGLRNLRKIDLLHSDIIPDLTSSYKFENLDSIGYLWTYDTAPYSDLSNFQNVEYIRKVFIINAGNLSGLHSNVRNTIEHIRIGGLENSPQGMFADLIEGRMHLQTLEVHKRQAIDLTAPIELMTIGYGNFSSNIIDLEPISHLQFDSLRVTNNSGSIADFENVESLKFLNLTMDSFPSIDAFVPNIKSIDELYLDKNPNITEVGLSQISGPEIIHITDNINLNDCNERFICEALANNPDQVIIEGNGPGCHLDTIRAYCMTVSTHKIENDKVKLFPNPARDRLFLEYEGLFDFEYSIYDAQGRLLREGIANYQEVEIQELSQGYYLLEVPVSDDIFRERFVKIE